LVEYLHNAPSTALRYLRAGGDSGSNPETATITIMNKLTTGKVYIRKATRRELRVNLGDAGFIMVISIASLFLHGYALSLLTFGH
jgi:hypothetical protein